MPTRPPRGASAWSKVVFRAVLTVASVGGAGGASIRGGAGVAWAQNAPVSKFEFAKPPQKEIDWKVQAKGGLLLTTGSSRARNGTLSVDASRQKGSNKLSLNGGFAYGKSDILVPTVDATTGDIVGFTRRGEESTNQWNSRARYDRFITPNNAVYVLGQLAADKIAGKRLFGGGQLGYSRQVFKDEQHTAVAELGYDFSYESYYQTLGKPPRDAVAIHSARVFVGELFSLTKETGFSGSVEALFNLNKEKALDASDGTGMTTGVAAFKDTRVVGKLGLTTLLRQSLSLGFGFTVRYDQNPAPRPLPVSAAGAMYAPGFQPFSDEVDTLTEATLIYTFL